MRTRNIFATIATVASLSGMAGLASAQGIDDPRRADYFKVYEGKTIAFVPVTMGIDLTEGWASVLKKQADTAAAEAAKAAKEAGQPAEK